MRTLTYSRDVRAMPLLLALAAAGVPVAAVRPLPGPAAAIDIEDYLDERDVAADAACDRVVAAHDPRVADAVASVAAQQALDDRAFLKAFQTLASPTAADIVRAIRAQTRMLRLLALAD